MLKIEKIKDEIKNHDTNSDDYLECWLHQITTNLHDNKNSCSSFTCSECLRLSLMELLEEYKEPWNIDNILANCEVIEDEKS